MKGLILKDLLLIKSNSRSLLSSLLILVLFSFTMGSSAITIIPLFSIMMVISTFSYDEYNKWDSYAITVSDRKNIVKSKYISSIIVLFLSCILSLIVGFILFKLGKCSIDDMFSSLMGGMVGVVFVMMIMYPFLYKFGVEKGRIFLFIIIFGIAFLLNLIFTSFNLNNILTFVNDYIVILLPVSAIVLLIISYLISKKIYSTKEF